MGASPRCRLSQRRGHSDHSGAPRRRPAWRMPEARLRARQYPPPLMSPNLRRRPRVGQSWISREIYVRTPTKHGPESRIPLSANGAPIAPASSPLNPIRTAEGGIRLGITRCRPPTEPHSVAEDANSTSPAGRAPNRTPRETMDRHINPNAWAIGLIDRFGRGRMYRPNKNWLSRIHTQWVS